MHYFWKDRQTNMETILIHITLVDNCKKCIGLGDNTEYRAIKIDGIIDENMNPGDYIDI